MHYANGREAKNGDKIVWKMWDGTLMHGVLVDAVAGNDYCNGKIAVIHPSLSPCLKDCLHADDVLPVFEPQPQAPNAEPVA